MEIHRQQCQTCGSYDLRNLLVREEGEPTVIYVRCIGCRNLVAQYKLGDYYHHGKGIDSYLKSHRHAAAESGRDVLAQFEKVQRDAIEGYERALRKLEEQAKAVDPEGPAPPPDASG